MNSNMLTVIPSNFTLLLLLGYLNSSMKVSLNTPTFSSLTSFPLTILIFHPTSKGHYIILPWTFSFLINALLPSSQLVHIPRSPLSRLFLSLSFLSCPECNIFKNPTWTYDSLIFFTSLYLSLIFLELK